MRESLFRPEVIEARRQTLVGPALAQRRLPARVVSAFSVGVLLALAAFLALGQYTRKVHVSGYLVPSAGLIRVAATQAGTIVERHVHEGQRVHRGDTLFVISSERALANTAGVQAAATAAIRQRERALAQERQAQQGLAGLEVDSTTQRIKSMQHELDEVSALVRAQEGRVAGAESALADHRKLLEDGFLARPALDQKRNDALDQRTRLVELRRDQAALARDIAAARQSLASASFKAVQDQARYERERVQLDQETIESESRRLVTVQAPTDGIATAVVVDIGHSIDARATLLTILPGDAVLQARLLVPTRAVGFLAEGDAVSMRYAAFPHQRFGTFRGRVVEIPRATAATDEMDTPPQRGEPVYRVMVDLESQSVRTARSQVPLRSGMTMEADIWLDRRRLVEWLFEPLIDAAARGKA